MIMINLKVVQALVSNKWQISALSTVMIVRSLSTIVFQNLSGQVINGRGLSTLFTMLFGFVLAGLVVVSLSNIPDGEDTQMFS